MSNTDDDDRNNAQSIVDAYHRAWTTGDVEQALTHVSDDVRCYAPDENITTKDDWRAYLTAFVPRLTGAPEHTRMTDEDRVALWYFPHDRSKDHDPGQRAVHRERHADRRNPSHLRPPELHSATTATGMTTAPAHDPARALLDRVHAALAQDHLREVRMFGVTAVMIDNAMAVATHTDGSLLVRVDPDEDATLLNHPHAQRARDGQRPIHGRRLDSRRRDRRAGRVRPRLLARRRQPLPHPT